MGSLQDLARFHRALPMSTWAGQSLDTQVTRPHRYRDCKSNDWKSHIGKIPSIEDRMVMVQEDQAKEPWFSYNGLIHERIALKLPMKLRNPSTAFLGYDAVLLQRS